MKLKDREQIDAIKERLNNISQGSWTGLYRDGFSAIYCGDKRILYGDRYNEGTMKHKENIFFLSCAKQDMEYLLKLIEK